MMNVFNDSIDAVILYVDMNDKEWQNRYNNYVAINNIPNKHINNKYRFRDYDTLKMVLRSIDLYAKWINNVFLVVQSESQVPDWINRETVNIVLHEDFIPKEFLPTFNCNTIETHLHLIPGLSEKFIYFNDDMILNTINYPEDYFINDKCVHLMYKKSADIMVNLLSSKFYQALRFSNSLVLHNILDNLSLDYAFYNSHGPTPMLKTLWEDVYNKISNIKIHMSTFREKDNLTQELFTIYALHKRKLILVNGPKVDGYVTESYRGNFETEHYNNLKEKMFSDIKFICVNDVFYNSLLENDIFLINDIIKTLNIRYNKKSKFEK